jgi:hypothetical protein
MIHLHNLLIILDKLPEHFPELSPNESLPCHDAILLKSNTTNKSLQMRVSHILVVLLLMLLAKRVTVSKCNISTIFYYAISNGGESSLTISLVLLPFASCRKEAKAERSEAIKNVSCTKFSLIIERDFVSRCNICAHKIGNESVYNQLMFGPCCC